jgi:hypothetical protein
MDDSGNGKLTAKIIFDRRALLIGVSCYVEADGRKVTYQAQILNVILRVGVKKSWAQWDRPIQYSAPTEGE